jgi:gentisate 1,2-dioxygenase
MARIFLRGIESEYGMDEQLKRLQSFPRVIKAKDQKWKKAGWLWQRPIVEPHLVPTQTIYMHMEQIKPGGHSSLHGHMNEAFLFVLDGTGHDIHDGVRYDWQAGDAMIVHNACVHRHYNDDPEKPARILVIKSKPMFMYMNLLFQGHVEHAPDDYDIGPRPAD